MSNRLGPLEIACDAPSYSVVRACRDLGLQSPEDVRWQRLSSFQQRWRTLTKLFGSGSWAGIFGGKEAHPAACSCGHPLPALETCSFLYRNGKTQSYWLGQCPRCRTIFWEEA